ncbi:MAG: hypothetical protein RL215_1736 [Planctomycetota bacterium]
MEKPADFDPSCHHTQHLTGAAPHAFGKPGRCAAALVNDLLSGRIRDAGKCAKRGAGRRGYSADSTSCREEPSLTGRAAAYSQKPVCQRCLNRTLQTVKPQQFATLIQPGTKIHTGRAAHNIVYLFPLSTLFVVPSEDRQHKLERPSFFRKMCGKGFLNAPEIGADSG